MNKEHLLADFEALQIDAEKFGHKEHVQAAFEILRKYDFVEACTRYAKTIKAMASNAGAPEKFNVTMTFAFMGLIAERIGQSQNVETFSKFIAANQDLNTSRVLNKWYTREHLHSDFARTNFALPDKTI